MMWVSQIKTKHEEENSLVRTIYVSVLCIEGDWEHSFGGWGSLLYMRPFLALTLVPFPSHPQERKYLE